MGAGTTILKVLFMVRLHYFVKVADGSKKFEARRATQRWRTIASRNPTEGVFLCGRRVHRRVITGSYVAESFESVAGRPPSEQGVKDIGLGPVVIFNLGAEVR
jgi:hypothetical protein